MHAHTHIRPDTYTMCERHVFNIILSVSTCLCLIKQTHASRTAVVCVCVCVYVGKYCVHYTPPSATMCERRRKMHTHACAPMRLFIFFLAGRAKYTHTKTAPSILAVVLSIARLNHLAEDDGIDDTGGRHHRCACAYVRLMSAFLRRLCVCVCVCGALIRPQQFQTN